MGSLSAIPNGLWIGLSFFEILCALGLLIPTFNKKLNILISMAAIGIASEMILFCIVHLASGDTSIGSPIYWLVTATICGFIAFGRLKLQPLNRLSNSIPLIILFFCMSQVNVFASTYERKNYLPAAPFSENIDDDLDPTNDTEIKKGISLLTNYPFSLKDLPLCLKSKVENTSIQKTISGAIQKWNTAAAKALNKSVFIENCASSHPDVELIFSNDSGDSADGSIKFGEVFFLKGKSPRIILLLRKKELTEFDQLLSKVRDQQIADKKMGVEQKEKFEVAFEKYRASKTEKMIDQIITHEFGHVLGLGHNTNPKEMSVMDYSDQSSLSEYDQAALRYRFIPSLPPTKEWKASLNLKPLN